MTKQPAPGLKVLIVAFKDLTRNSRVVRQAAALTARGHRVTVYSLEPPDAKLIQQVPEISYFHTGVIDLPYPGLIRPGKSYKFRGQDIIREVRRFWHSSVHFLISRKYYFARFCRKQSREKQFDVVVVHDHHSMIAAAAVAFFSRASFVVDLVEVPYHQLPAHLDKTSRFCRRVENFVERQLLRRCSQTFTVSISLAKYLARRGFGKDVKVIRNFQNFREPTRGTQIRDDAGLESDDVMMLFLNNIYQGDGMDFIIQSLAETEKKVKLVILGAFPLKDHKDALFQLANDLGVEDRIRVLPLVPQPELLDYISGADFGIIARQKTSLNVRVSLPNRLGELAMARLPVIVCRCADIKRIVQTHAIGMVCKETEPSDIAAKINQMADDGTRESYRHNIEAAIAELSWPQEADRFVAIVENAAGRTAGADNG